MLMERPPGPAFKELRVWQETAEGGEQEVPREGRIGISNFIPRKRIHAEFKQGRDGSKCAFLKGRLGTKWRRRVEEHKNESWGRPPGSGKAGGGRTLAIPGTTHRTQPWAVSRRASGLATHAGGWVEGPLLARETRRGTAEHGSCETQLCVFV